MIYFYNFIILMSLITVIFFFIHLFYLEYKLIKKHREQWNGIKRCFNFASKEDEIILYRAYIDTIPPHWLLGKCYPYREEE